jgi:hypothetical protein
MNIYISLIFLTIGSISSSFFFSLSRTFSFFISSTFASSFFSSSFISVFGVSLTTIFVLVNHQKELNNQQLQLHQLHVNQPYYLIHFNILSSNG